MGRKMNDIELYNGVKIPAFCYGTGIVFRNRYSERNDFTHVAKYFIRNAIYDRRALSKDLRVKKVIQTAYKNGCRCYDTSRAYGGSEWVLGKSLKEYPRDQLFLVSKLCNTDQYANRVAEGFDKSLKELGTDYIDLYLMHWPVEDIFLDSWHEMEKLYVQGKCRAIGVCNCNVHHLQRIESESSIMPMVNQFECHPLFIQDRLRSYCNEKKIAVMAYTANARMDDRLVNSVVSDIATKHDRTVSQIVMRWHIQIGNIPIVNTYNISHIVEDLNVFDFELTDDEIMKISDLNINSRLRYDPDNCDFRRL